MTRIFALLSIAILASGCRDPKPSANLNYAKVYQTPSTFVVEFNSDLNFEELYATNKNEEIIVKKLVCALGDDKNLEVEHNMRYVFRGDLELQGTSKVGRYTWQQKIGTLQSHHDDLFVIPLLFRRDVDTCRRHS
jgi:hypothetical protein